MKTLLETLNYQPHTLNDGDVEHPEAAIAHFFLFHELHKTRKSLQDFYLAWQHLHADNPQTEEMRDMGFFFTSLIDLVNASYVVNYHYNLKEELD